VPGNDAEPEALIRPPGSRIELRQVASPSLPGMASLCVLADRLPTFRNLREWIIAILLDTHRSNCFLLKHLTATEYACQNIIHSPYNLNGWQMSANYSKVLTLILFTILGRVILSGSRVLFM
jgi:hypothetical protein